MVVCSLVLLMEFLYREMGWVMPGRGGGLVRVAANAGLLVFLFLYLKQIQTMTVMQGGVLSAIGQGKAGWNDEVCRPVFKRSYMPATVVCLMAIPLVLYYLGVVDGVVCAALEFVCYLLVVWWGFYWVYLRRRIYFAYRDVIEEQYAASFRLRKMR